MDFCAAVSRRRRPLLLAVCSLAAGSIWGGCASRTVSIPSPDGATVLKARVATETTGPPPVDCVVLDFEDAAGHATFSVNTHASNFMRWDVAWVSNTRAVLKSGDIGETFWDRQADGTWKKHIRPGATDPETGEMVSPDPVPSPDGATILKARVARDAADPAPMDCVVLDFENAATHATYSANTKESYIPYVNRWEVAWESNTRAALTSSVGKSFWDKQVDGTWKRAK